MTLNLAVAEIKKLALSFGTVPALQKSIFYRLTILRS